MDFDIGFTHCNTGMGLDGNSSGNDLIPKPLYICLSLMSSKSTIGCEHIWDIVLLNEFRRDVVEAPETTLAGRVATREQNEQVAKARGVAGQVEHPDAPAPVEDPDASSSPSEENQPSDRSAAMQRLLDAKRMKQQGDDA